MNIEELRKTAADVLHNLKIDPELARGEILRDPIKLLIIRELFKPGLETYLQEEFWLSELFSKYLSPVDPDSTVLCLGSGTGLELLHLRKLIPKGTLIGIDKNVSFESVVTEILADASFIQEDLERLTIAETMNHLSSPPNIVICRHPWMSQAPWFSDVLVNWGKFIRDNNGVMLITSFDSSERSKIVQGLAGVGIIPSLGTYEGGVPKSTVTAKPDRLITFVRY